MTASDDYLDFVSDLLREIPGLQVKRMFGGAGVFGGGCMFALIADNELYLGVSESDRSVLAAAGSEPFRYASRGGSRVMKGYWRVPPDWFDNPGLILAVARRTLAARASSGSS